MTGNFEYKTLAGPVEIKADGQQDDGKLHIKAYVLAFGNIDSWGDIIQPSACDDFLKSENADRMHLCYPHKLDEVIGVITEKGVDEKGMWIEADIIDTATGTDVQKLIKAGAVTEFSIGYVADRWSYGKADDGQEVRYLESITIWEASPVTRAANPLAVLVDSKSEDTIAAIKALSDEQLEIHKSFVDEEYFRRFIYKL